MHYVLAIEQPSTVQLSMRLADFSWSTCHWDRLQ